MFSQKQKLCKSLLKRIYYKLTREKLLSIKMSWSSLSNWLWSKQQTVLDLKKDYLKVEFLTQEEKVKKDLAIGPLLQKAEEDEDTIIPFEDYYPCSHRFTFRAGDICPINVQNPQIMVKEIIANIILSTDEATRTFYQTYINGIEVIMKDNEALSNNDLVELYNQTQINSYDPSKILEIIYNEKSLWERLKNKTKSTIKKIPSLIAAVFERIFGLILTLLGLNGGITSLIWKAIPSQKIIQWLAILISMFFPALAPVLGLSKFIF